MTVSGEAKREWGKGNRGWKSNFLFPIPHSLFPTPHSLFVFLALFTFFVSYSLSYAQPAKAQKQ
jgi:hypothetical protein